MQMQNFQIGLCSARIPGTQELRLSHHHRTGWESESSHGGRLVIYPAKLLAVSPMIIVKSHEARGWRQLAIFFICSQHEAFRNFPDIDLGSVQKLDMICLEVQEQCLKTSSENRQFLRTGKAEAKALRDKEEVMRWHLSALVGKVID